MVKPPRIVIADSDEFIRNGIRDALQNQAGWEIAAEASDGKEAIMQARVTGADVVIMDIDLPELNGLDAARQILQFRPQTHVLLLSMRETEPILREVIASGAQGYILKSTAGDNLVGAIESVLSGRSILAASAARLPAPEILTAREREILQLLGEGKSNKEIAGMLAISTRTVETHRRNLMSKLQLHSIADVVRYAVRNRIASV